MAQKWAHQTYQQAANPRPALAAWLVAVLLAVLFILSTPQFAVAQDSVVTPPPFTEKMLQARLESVAVDSDLTEEQKAQAKTALELAISRLSDSQELESQRAQYQGDLENGTANIARVNEQIKEQRALLAQPPVPLGEMIGEAALYKLEQQLLQKESALRALQAEAEGYTSSLQRLSARQSVIPGELNEARTKLSEITASLADTADSNLDTVAAARNRALRARQYYRQVQTAALEAELASLPQRQELVTARRALTNLRAELVSRDVRALQEQTGQRRVKEAVLIEQQTMAALDELLSTHPAVTAIAEENLELARQIKTIAERETLVSKETASARGLQAYVADDVTAAKELVSSGSLDREAGATLRRLENQFSAPREIKSNIEQTRQYRTDATRQRIVAQEALRDLPLGQLDPVKIQRAVRDEFATAPPLTMEDFAEIQILLDQQRDLLRQVAQAASSRINHLSELQGVQEALLSETEELQALLSENLLWVPSVPAISLSWPAEVVKGAFEVVSPSHLSTIAVVALEQVRAFWPFLLAFGLLIFALIRVRPRLWDDILRRSEDVGRVTVDSAWHTPSVAVSGLLMALPFPLIFLVIAFMFELSDSPEPIIEGISDGFLNLAIFAFILITWRVWDRDKSLFAAHFKLPRSIRHAVNRNLRWLLPVLGVAILFSGIAGSLSSQTVAEGFNLFIFIVIAVSLAVFGFRVLWSKRDQWAQYLATDSFLTRHRNAISVLVIGAPSIVAVLAAAGYLESAGALLERLFLSGVLLLIAYVAYGIVKRAITVAQRQIKYRQAIERRDAALKAREEKAEAEERGEDMPTPAPVDTTEIDISTITRQSSQLLSLIIAIGIAAFFWMIWSDLLPALTFFDGFEVWDFDTGKLREDGQPLMQSVTVWSIIQSLVIIILTVTAARNLPGFLEVFVLNRMGVDAGTRYAMVTVLGYVIIGVGVIVSLDRLGLQWSQLKWIATGLSVGIGLGLQKIIANFVSGLIILFERPVRIGDYVTIGEQSGTVSRIQIRATTLADLDNREILIPNEALISERVTNWTLSSSITRLIVPVGIAYGSDTDAARDLMYETLKVIPKVLDNPPPQVLFVGFGDSSLDFELRVFLRNFEDRVPMRHTIHTEINRALANAGVTIPFPQSDLHIVSQTGPLEISSKPASKQKAKPKAKPKAPPKST
ncbi:mechanosensitive ion channel domain-containing protein [Litorimonas sp. RW-G-Af-16]|uniref:mechanosensitive ion channel domain-containing protein n=1 Tax=Litorimonas sp. RW-G-Af-16 TaxID=3241168 RepID=UPI00390CA0D6